MLPNRIPNTGPNKSLPSGASKNLKKANVEIRNGWSRPCFGAYGANNKFHLHQKTERSPPRGGLDLDIPYSAKQVILKKTSSLDSVQIVKSTSDNTTSLCSKSYHLWIVYIHHVVRFWVLTWDQVFLMKLSFRSHNLQVLRGQHFWNSENPKEFQDHE